MSKDLKATTLQLINQIKAALTGDELVAASPVLDAIRDGRIWFEREDWYDLTTDAPYTLCAELLLRATNPDGTPLSVRPLLDITQTKPLYRLLDPLLILHQVDATIRNNGFPVSLNISSRNACDPDALPALHAMLQDHFGDQVNPANIMFELLEDYQADNPVHDSLMLMRNHGYSFAIDDQSHLAADMVRAHNLAPYVDIIKIDGQTVDAARRGYLSLHAFLEKLKVLAPQAELLCEWISSPEEASDLYNALPLIRYVQGRDLDFTAAEFIARMRAGNPHEASRFLIGPPKPPEL